MIRSLFLKLSKMSTNYLKVFQVNGRLNHLPLALNIVFNLNFDWWILSPNVYPVTFEEQNLKISMPHWYSTWFRIILIISSLRINNQNSNSNNKYDNTKIRWSSKLFNLISPISWTYTLEYAKRGESKK